MSNTWTLCFYKERSVFQHLSASCLWNVYGLNLGFDPCQKNDIPVIQYCAKVTQANFDEFLGFSKKFCLKRNFRDFSANFQVTYCFIPPELSNDNSRWTLMSHEISRESSLFSIVNREILEENLLWSLKSALTRTKQNTATVRNLLLCKETLRTSEITFINSIKYHIVLTCWLFDFQCILTAKHVRVSVQTSCFDHVSTPDSKTWIGCHFVRVTNPFM